MIIVRKIQIPGLPTEKPRRLYIYLPKGYDGDDRRYPVLYMFDGHNVFYDSHATYGKSWGMKEYLSKTKCKIIVVAVECNPEGNRRLFEYTPFSFSRRPIGRVDALGKVTMDWMTGELKPEIDKTYRTLADREHTFIAGSSMGGLMSIYAAVEYNDVFSKAAALSPSLWVDRKGLADLIKNKPLAEPTMLYMDMGSGEAKDYPALIRYMFTTAGQLSGAGADVDARVVPGAMHSEAYWEERIPVFFEYLEIP